MMKEEDIYGIVTGSTNVSGGDLSNSHDPDKFNDFDLFDISETVVRRRRLSQLSVGVCPDCLFLEIIWLAHLI